MNDNENDKFNTKIHYALLLSFLLLGTRDEADDVFLSDGCITFSTVTTGILLAAAVVVVVFLSAVEFVLLATLAVVVFTLLA